MRRLLFLFCALAPASAWSAGESALFQELFPSARASALAEAVVASRGLDLVGADPAAAAGLEGLGFYGSHGLLVQEVSMDEAVLGYGSPLGTFYGRGLMVQAPDFAALDVNGVQVGTASFRETALGLGWAGEWQKLSVGVSGQMLLRGVGRSQGDGQSFSAGLQWEVLPGLRLGAALRNAGTLSALVNAADVLQPSSSVGAGWRLAFGSGESLELMGALTRQPLGDWRGAGGLEFGLGQLVFVRGGYSLDQAPGEAGPFSAGFGVRFSGLDLDAAWVPYGDLGQSFRFSGTFALGALGGDPAAPWDMQLERAGEGLLLSWKAPTRSPEAAYRIFMRQDPKDTARELTRAPTKSTRLRLRSFHKEQSYRFSVVAVDAQGRSGPSSRETVWMGER